VIKVLWFLSAAFGLIGAAVTAAIVIDALHRIQ
jgi:hypothetical protein